MQEKILFLRVMIIVFLMVMSYILLLEVIIMSKTRSINMTEGSTLRLIGAFALPMLVGNLFQQFYNIADSIIVGKLLGADALAAVGATNYVTFLFFALCNGIGNGGGIVTSQFYGAGDNKKVKACIVNTGYIMLAFPLIVGMIGLLLSKPLLILLGTPESILAVSLTYLRTMCVGILFVAMYNFISSVLRALGDSRTPLYFLVASCIINIALDITFVNLGFGVVGAGLATIISQFLCGITCIIYSIKTNEYFKLSRDNMSLDFNIIKSTIRLGIPLSLQFSMIAVSCMALQRVVNSFGATTVAAFTAVSRIEQVIHQPYQTMGATMSTYTGQNYGAKKVDRIKAGYRTSLFLIIAFTLLMLPIMQLFGKQIVSIFVNDRDVIEMGSKAIRITSLFYIFLAVIYDIRGVLGGLGDAAFSLINGIIEVIGRCSLPFLLCAIPAISVWGLWWATGIVWFLAGFTAWLRYIFYGKKLLRRLYESHI